MKKHTSRIPVLRSNVQFPPIPKETSQCNIPKEERKINFPNIFEAGPSTAFPAEVASKDQGPSFSSTPLTEGKQPSRESSSQPSSRNSLDMDEILTANQMTDSLLSPIPVCSQDTPPRRPSLKPEHGFSFKQFMDPHGDFTLLDDISFPECFDACDSIAEMTVLRSPDGSSLIDEVSFPDNELLDSVASFVEDANLKTPEEQLLSGSDDELTAASSVKVDASETTLSPEELPADAPVPQPARSESQNIIQAPPGRPAGGTSIVTSVTSITSLDTGYQGDGENSRPASRGNKPAPPDPMTDSDFFTESDADGHEEIAAALGRGDRRAQVIDGTLYGSAQHEQCPSFSAEEMLSSGVFSDLDRKTDSPVSKEDDSSTHTVASNGDNEPQLLSPTTKVMPEPTSATDTTPIGESAQDENEVLSVSDKDPSVAKPLSGNKSKMDPPEIKKHKMPRRNVASKIKVLIESSQNAVKDSAIDENQENKRPPRKSPRKGNRWDAVMNKIAESQAQEKNKLQQLKEVKSKVSTRPSMPPPRKPSSLPRTPKALPPSSCQSEPSLLKSKRNHENRRSANSSIHSSNSDISEAPTTTTPRSKTISSLRASKKREVGRTTSPLSDGSSNSNTPSRPPDIRNHNIKSSTLPAPSAASRGRQLFGFPLRPPNVQDSGRSSWLSPSPKSRLLPEKSPVGTEMKTPATRKSTPRRSSNNNQKKALRDHNRLNTNNVPIPPNKPQQAAVPALRPQHEILAPQIKHACLGFDALAVLVQYLVQDLEAFSTPQFKKELEKMKSKWLNTTLELEELKASYRRLEDTLVDEREIFVNEKNQHQKLLLEMENKFHAQIAEEKGNHSFILQRKDEEERKLKQCVEETKTALKEAIQVQDQLKYEKESLHKELTSIKTKYGNIMDSMQKDKDTKLQVTAGRCRELQDEVDSLRTVLELKSQENQDLRRQIFELSAAAEELPNAVQKITILQARVEDLQAQLDSKIILERQLFAEKQKLEESFIEENKQKKRLSQYNEELQYKLKRNVEAISSLVNSSGSPNSSVTFSQSYWNDMTGINSTPITHQKFPARPHSASIPIIASNDCDSPKVKAVVEKSDSVSWVLDMENSSEVFSRILRRSGSLRRVSSASSPAHSRSHYLSKRPVSKVQNQTVSPVKSDSDGECFDWHMSGSTPRPTDQINTSKTAQESFPPLHSACQNGLKRVGESIDIEDNGEYAVTSCFPSRVSNSKSVKLTNGSQNVSPVASCLELESEAEELPLPPLPDSTGDLARFCSRSHPKEAAGEAMISEETSEEENNNERSTSDEDSCSEDDSSSSESSSEHEIRIPPAENCKIICANVKMA